MCRFGGDADRMPVGLGTAIQVVTCSFSSTDMIVVDERPATVPAGSALIYDMRTFHRGSARLPASASSLSRPS